METNIVISGAALGSVPRGSQFTGKAACLGVNIIGIISSKCFSREYCFVSRFISAIYVSLYDLESLGAGYANRAGRIRQHFSDDADVGTSSEVTMSSGVVMVNYNEFIILSSGVDYAFGYVVDAECADELQAGIAKLIHTSARNMFPFQDSPFSVPHGQEKSSLLQAIPDLTNKMFSPLSTS